jgi:hypothetical protein
MYGERSQVVKALVCGTGIRGFESPRSPLISILKLKNPEGLKTFGVFEFDGPNLPA